MPAARPERRGPAAAGTDAGPKSENENEAPHSYPTFQQGFKGRQTPLSPEAGFENDNGRDKPLSFHSRAEEDVFEALFGSSGDRAVRNSILTTAVLAFESGERWVSYSRRRGFYLGRYSGTPLSYDRITKAVEWALSEGLIEEERARPGDHLLTGLQSRFRAMPCLVEAYRGAQLRHDLLELIRLRDEIGRLMPYRDTDATLRMRRQVERINEYLRTILVGLDAPGVTRTGRHLVIGEQHILVTPPGLYRVFNRGLFRLGGRLYGGWWQSIPNRLQKLRERLLVNGEPVAEPDYEALHARMLYGQRGLKLEIDPYETGEFPRREGKLAFLIALNARTAAAAIGAIADGLGVERRRAAKLLKTIKARHPDIADAFGSDVGITLMKADSELTLDVMRQCVDADIPALPVHDSFVTMARHEGRVREIMDRCFTDRFSP
jgi:hypothetical protein